MTRADLPGRRGRRSDRGLATLSWLLIVAAVASLAALAVVLVQAEVEDTAERISNPDPRVTSAIHSAFAVESDAKAAGAADFELWADWESHFTRQCSLIAVLYTDADVEVVHSNFNPPPDGGPAFDPPAAAAADDQSPGTGKARVRCEVR